LKLLSYSSILRVTAKAFFDDNTTVKLGDVAALFRSTRLVDRGKLAALFCSIRLVSTLLPGSPLFLAS